MFLLILVMKVTINVPNPLQLKSCTKSSKNLRALRTATNILKGFFIPFLTLLAQKYNYQLQHG